MINITVYVWHGTSSDHYQIWGVNSEQENLAFGKEKTETKCVFWFKKWFWIQSKQTPTLVRMHLTPSQLISLCECGLAWVNETWMHPSSATAASHSAPARCSKSPSISNTVFCPSSLLASAGAHKVVIFFKVCMDPHLLNFQNELPSSSSCGIYILPCWLFVAL